MKLKSNNLARATQIGLMAGLGLFAGAVNAQDAIVRIQGLENMAGLDRYAVNGTGQDSMALLWGDMIVNSDHHGNYAPGIVTKWTWAEDGMSVTLSVRDGVVFSNGEALTAEDVAFTIERLKNPDLPNARAWQAVEKAEVTAPLTVQVTFASPMPVFLNLSARTPVIDASAFAANPAGYFNLPVGTGPYTVTAFDGPTGHVVLTRKDDWWGWDSANNSNVDTIEYVFSSADQSRISALQAGEAEIIQKVPVNETERLTGEGYTVHSYNEVSQVYIGLRAAEGEPFANPQLRQALSLIIDRNAIVNDLLGGGRVSTWPSMPDTVGYRDHEPYAYDPTAAADLVKQSGYSGEQLDLLLPAGLFAQGQEVAEAIQAMAAGIGLNIAVQSLETATFQEYITAGNYDLYMNSFTMVNADSFTQITSLIGRDRFNTGYVNEDIANLAKEAGTTVDLEARDAITASAYDIIMAETAPNLYLYEPMGVTASVATVTGFIPFPDGIADFRYMHKE